MEWNYILLWFAGSSCLVNLINATRARPPLKGWIGVSALIIAVGVLLYWFIPDVAGLTVGAVWFALVLAPALMQRRITRLTVAQRFGSARYLAAIARWLHPFDGMWQQPALLRALELSEGGDVDAAAALLERLRDGGPPRIARAATAYLCRLRGDWPQFIELVRTSIP